MSNRSKGVRRERECREMYEEAGYCPAATSNGSRWGDTDLFNRFDAIALHPRRRIRFIQVKSNGTGGDLKEFFRWANYNLHPGAAVAHFAVCYDSPGGGDGGGWKLYESARDKDCGYHIPVDERGEPCKVGDRVTAYLAGEP